MCVCVYIYIYDYIHVAGKSHGHCCFVETALSFLLGPAVIGAATVRPAMSLLFPITRKCWALA